MIPPVEIEDRIYVDGALGTAGGVPIKIVQQQGYDEYLVVLTHEREYQKVPKKYPKLYRAYFRKMPGGDAIT